MAITCWLPVLTKARVPWKHLLAHYFLLSNPDSSSRQHQLAATKVICLASTSNTLLDKPAPSYSAPKEENTHESYLASKSKSTALLFRAPSISSFTLAKGWSDSSLEAFTAAVNAVVKANPVLTGRATAKVEAFQTATEIRIEPGFFLPGQHSFVEQIDATTDKVPSPKDLDDAGQLAYIDKFVAPRIGNYDTVLEQIENESPLFTAKVVLLPDSYACFFIKISHCIGDLVTCFNILDQISSFEKKGTIQPIEWDNPLIASHEIFPENFSKKDIDRSYGLPFLLGVICHFPLMFLRNKEYLLLSRDKVKRKQQELQATSADHVSSNDIVTAALCDANRSTDVFAFTRSMRGVTPGIGSRTGGNLHCEIPFQRCAGRNPHVIQDILAKGKYFESDEVPLGPALTGRVGRITNCVIAARNTSFGKTETVCHCPPKMFLNYCPLDTAIIFRMNKENYGVLHNFKDNEESVLLNDLLAITTPSEVAKS